MDQLSHQEQLTCPQLQRLFASWSHDDFQVVVEVKSVCNPKVLGTSVENPSVATRRKQE